MPGRVVTKTLERVPGLRHMPVAKLIVIGELLLLAREHFDRLEPHERRRLVYLMRRAHGRPRNLSPGERGEFAKLVAKSDPRLFAGLAASRLSPVPLPRRVVRGRRR